MSTQVKGAARFDARLPQKQKELFEKAAQLGGYRNLTDFVILTAQEKANTIIKEKEQAIVSKRDSQIFFEAITKPQKPNKALRQALQEYNTYTSKSKK
ncbi:MAG: DUF1778 domain-containing protein [Bacteroidetes bacterium]|nr:DUF1778 domain-containing protein [Bacteroidota bacterium]